MTRLLIINYSMSRSSLVFSHQREVVYALSEHFDTTVITTEINSNPDSISVIHSPWRQNARFISTLIFLKKFLIQIAKVKPNVVFSHMTDFHAFVISPICWLLGIRHFLWYAHASKSPYLYLAHPFLSGILTSTSGSCPIKSPKVSIIGQGIPETFSRCHFSSSPSVPPLRWYHLGRIDKSKNIEAIVDAVHKVRVLGFNISIDLIGKPSSGTGDEYFETLKKLYSGIEYRGWVNFVGPIERKSVPAIISRYDGFIHSFRGSLDKTLVEAAMCRRIILTINEEFWAEFNGAKSSQGFSVPSLESQLARVMQEASDSIMAEINRHHSVALKSHSFDGWVQKTSNILRSN